MGIFWRTLEAGHACPRLRCVWFAHGTFVSGSLAPGDDARAAVPPGTSSRSQSHVLQRSDPLGQWRADSEGPHFGGVGLGTEARVLSGGCQPDRQAAHGPTAPPLHWQEPQGLPPGCRPQTAGWVTRGPAPHLRHLQSVLAVQPRLVVDVTAELVGEGAGVSRDEPTEPHAQQPRGRLRHDGAWGQTRLRCTATGHPTPRPRQRLPFLSDIPASAKP